MKLLPKVLSITALSIGGITILPISSCSKYETIDVTNEEAAEFINDRTFSIMQESKTKTEPPSTSWVFGTAWIIDSVTKAATDYSYYLATNLHVTHGMNLNNDSIVYKYADKSLATGGVIPTSSYIQFPTGGFVVEPLSNFLYNSYEQSDYLKSCIDLSVIKVNFGSPTGQIKTKLDKLNAKKQKDGCINTFASDNTKTRKANKFVAGYPVEQNSSTEPTPRWEFHKLQANELRYYDINYEYTESQTHVGQKGHAVGEPNRDQQGNPISGGKESYYYYDISPQYWSTVDKTSNFMPGGASGSMIVTGDLQICGIYWGGWTATTGAFYPSFSIFNSYYGDFLSPYLS